MPRLSDSQDDMKLECSNHKSVMSYKELSSLEYPAVVGDPPANTYKNVINLFSQPCDIVSPATLLYNVQWFTSEFQSQELAILHSLNLLNFRKRDMLMILVPELS